MIYRARVLYKCLQEHRNSNRFTRKPIPPLLFLALTCFIDLLKPNQVYPLIEMFLSPERCVSIIHMMSQSRQKIISSLSLWFVVVHPLTFHELMFSFRSIALFGNPIYVVLHWNHLSNWLMALKRV